MREITTLIQFISIALCLWGFILHIRQREKLILRLKEIDEEAEKRAKGYAEALKLVRQYEAEVMIWKTMIKSNEDE